MANFHHRWVHARQSLMLALALAGVPVAQAQGEFVEHQVRPGDTPEALAAQYLGAPELWPHLQSHNGVGNPRRLRPGTVLRIPSELLPMGSARVHFVQGDAQVLLPGATAPVALQAGQALPEGARVQVPADGFINVRLSDGTVIRVQADSEVRLRQLRRRGRAGDAQSVLELERGGVESTVPPSRSGARRFEIRTPMASTSVRGTRFGVQLDRDGRTLTAVTEGSVAVGQRTGTGVKVGSTALVHSGHGVAVAANGSVGTPQALLAAPNLAALPDAVHDADFLSLTLTPVAGAVAYQVQVARDAELTEVLRSGTFATPAVRLRAVEDGQYRLAVRAVDAMGLPGMPAQRTITVKAHPVPPLYQAPAAGGTLSRTQGALACTPVSGASRYRIQVAADEGFSTPVLDTTGEQCNAAVTSLPPGRYHWRAASLRVLPGGGLDQGPYALPQPFTVAENPPALSASALSTGSEDEAGLHLRWPAEPGQRFRVQVSSSEDFSVPLVDEVLDTPAWSSTTLPPGEYFVRIQTRDPSGLESDFSTARQVRAQPAVRSGAGVPVTTADGKPLSRP